MLIASAAERRTPEENLDALPYGLLFELVLTMADEYHGHETLSTVYDNAVVTLQLPFDDGDPGTYRMIQGRR